MGIPIGSPKPATFWSTEDETRQKIATAFRDHVRDHYDVSRDKRKDVLNDRIDEAFEHDPEYQRLLASVDAKPTGLLGRIRNFFW